MTAATIQKLAFDNTRVRCFRRCGQGGLRAGVWCMEPDDDKGVFIHGSKNECQPPQYSLQQLSRWSQNPGLAFIRVLEISPRAALRELEGFPEARTAIVEMFKKFSEIER